MAQSNDIKYLEDIPHYDLFSRGADAFGQNEIEFAGRDMNHYAQNSFDASVPGNFITTGEGNFKLNIVEGFIQSPDFVTGETGWRISYDKVNGSIIEIETGYFRGSITAAYGTFGKMKLNDPAYPNALVIFDENDVLKGIFGYLLDGF